MRNLKKSYCMRRSSGGDWDWRTSEETFQNWGDLRTFGEAWQPWVW